jgi:hypothetical protein
MFAQVSRFKPEDSSGKLAVTGGKKVFRFDFRQALTGLLENLGPAQRSRGNPLA